jgi:hypothetical protein
MNPKEKRLLMAGMLVQPFQSERGDVFRVPAGIEKLVGAREGFVIVLKVVV